MKKFILVFILFLLPVLVLAEEAVRTWTTSAGKEMPGVWEMEKDTDEEKIHIRSNGKLYRVKVEKLSEADQTYIAEKRAASRSIDDDAFEEVVEEPEAGEKAIVVADREGLREEAHRYALLIGVNEYNKPISSLKFCMNDMKYLAETFEAIGFQRENITLMTDASASDLRPTKNNILNQVEMLCEMMSPEDLLIIAFSGHGVMVDGKAYLCPGDANAENADSLVSRDWVYEQLETSQAAQKLIIVDACRNEITIAGSRSFGNARTLEDPTGAQGKGFVLLASCRPKQVSWEIPELKHGVFTHFLAEGLRGGAKNDEGYVSILALADYASQKTKTYVHRNLNTLQVPMVQMPDEMTNFLLAKIDHPPLPTLDELKKQLDGKFEYKISEGSVTITEYTGSAASVEIPYGVVAIGDEAFEDCNSLTSVTIPDSVTSIGDHAFYECESLTSVTIPNSVTSIGGPFAVCDQLTEIRVSAGNTHFKSVDGILFTADGKTLIQFPKGKGHTEYTIPDGVTSIGNSAFYDCDSLTSVTIPDSVTSIGDYAFYYCTSLTSVTIPASVTSIGDNVFIGCDNVTIYGSAGSEAERYAKEKGIKFQVPMVQMPNEMTNFLLAKIDHPPLPTLDELKKQLDGKFEYKISEGSVTITKYTGSAASVEIPYGVVAIGDEAFEDCNSLTSVTIPDSVTSIGDYAFFGCTSLTSVTIPDSVTSIGDYAFFGCDSLTSVTIPDSVTSIGDDAFSNCSSLTSVTIPNGVTSIGDSAFQYCENLTSVTIPNSVTSIGGGPFAACDQLTEIQVFAGNTHFKSEDGILFTADGKTLIQFPAGKSLTKYTIPESVTSIGDGAFSSCTSLTSVTIPDSVTSIGNKAFFYCSSLTSVTIPDSVTSIGNYAFWGCKSLESVTIPDSVTSIGDHAFYECESLTSVTIPNSVTSIGNEAFRWCESLTSVTIPDSVTSIGNKAFYECSSLTSVTIPDSVTSIGDSAFSYCYSLTSVTIPDSVTSIGNSAFEDCNSLTSVTIPDSVTSIGDRAFSSCDSLTSVTIPDSVTSIGNAAFSWCRRLTSVTIPDSVTSIGYGLFTGCHKLTEIRVSAGNTHFKSVDGILFTADGKTLIQFPKGKGHTEYSIPDGVTSIGDYAFFGCDSLTSVTIPDSVTSIGDYAFYYCTSLTSVTIPASVTSIGDNVFIGCDNVTIYGSAGSEAERYAKEDRIKFQVKW